MTFVPNAAKKPDDTCDERAGAQPRRRHAGGGVDLDRCTWTCPHRQPIGKRHLLDARLEAETPLEFSAGFDGPARAPRANPVPASWRSNVTAAVQVTVGADARPRADGNGPTPSPGPARAAAAPP